MWFIARHAAETYSAQRLRCIAQKSVIGAALQVNTLLHPPFVKVCVNRHLCDGGVALVFSFIISDVFVTTNDATFM